MATSSPRGVYSGVPTPIRAITTPLRSSAAPPIPPASQLYEPLAKAVLRRRLTNRIFPYTALICVLSSAIWLVWIHRFAFARLLGASMVFWVGAVLPVIVLRKEYLTVTRTSAPSPLLLVQKSLAPPLSARTYRVLQAHLLSALCVLAIHATLDPTLPVFIKSRKHPYTPHPVLVLLALSQCALAALYVLRSVLRDVWVFPFHRPTLSPSPGALLAPLVLPLAAIPLALVTLFIVIPIFRRVPIVSLLLRPIRSPHMSVLRSLGRAWVLGVQTAGLWEAAAGVWGWAVGEPLCTTPSIRALVSGISVAVTPAPTPSASTSSSVFSTPSPLSGRPSFLSAPPPPALAPLPAAQPLSIYTHLAYAELLAIASAPEAKAREGAFDADVWARLAREALILLGREYRVLLGRGTPAASPTPAPAPSAPASASVFIIQTGPAPPVTPLLKQNIFVKQSPASPGARVSAALASGGALEEIVAPTLERLPVASALPAWDWDWRQHIPALRLPAGVRKAVALATGGTLVLPRAWTQVRQGRAVTGWVPRREVCVAAVGVLTHLTCASLKEDRLGVVQRDIPRVLEALIEFLGAVEAAQGGLRPSMKGREGETETEREERVAEERDLEEARAVLGDVGDALKEGLARIARTFGDKLRAFRFPPRTAARLQEFVDYCA